MPAIEMPTLAGIDRRYPDLLPLILLALFGVGFFFPVLFLGRAAAISSLRNAEPWRTARIEAGDGTVEYVDGAPVTRWNTPEGFADDLNRQFIPWGLYAQERLRSGEWPLWNPHLACGQPLFANHQTGLTNPLVLLCYLVFPGISAFAAIFLSVFILSGWAMYAYLRILGLGRWPSLLGAATYQFILGYIPTLDTLIVEKAILPMLLYSIERLVRAPSGKAAVWAFLSIVLLALVQTSCHAQEAVFISYLLGPYILFAAGDSDSFPAGRIWRTFGKRLVLLIGIYVPAILLGLMQNLPTWEFYTLSTRAVGFEEQISTATELERNLTWIQSLMIAFPRLFGDYIEENLPLEHYLLNYGYVGIVTLLAALFAGWAGATRRQVWFWRIAALVFFVSIIWNWFYFVVLCSLPLFRVSLQKPFSPLFFSLVVLAGHGYKFLLEPRPAGTLQNRLLGYLSLLTWGAVISLGALVIYSRFLPAGAINEELAYVFGQIEIGVVVAALACLVISMYWRRANARNRPGGQPRGLTIAALGLLLVILIDLWPMKAHFNPFVRREDIYFRTDPTDLLASRLDWRTGEADGPYRFGRSWSYALPPNAGMMYGLDDFGGYDSNLVGRYAQLLEAVDSSIVFGVHYIESPQGRRPFRSRVWDMLGVRYVLAHPGHLGQFEPPDRWRHIYKNGLLVVENLEALPRMHLVELVTLAELRGDALAHAVRLDPSREAVIERKSPIPVDLAPVDDPEADSLGEVITTDYRPERVVASVDCSRPALVCFFDTWFPGWEVTVDGARAEIERVNYTFKGVFVEAGHHEVVFSYRPKSWRYGLIGSLVGLLLALALARPLSRLTVGRGDSLSAVPSASCAPNADRKGIAPPTT